MGRSEIGKFAKVIINQGLDRASQVFSKMIKVGAKIESSDIYLTDITDVASRVTEDNSEMVAAIVDLEGDAHFKFMFMVRIEDALSFTDRMLRREIGSTKDFDELSQSSVQELGNVMASALTNVFSSSLNIRSFPTPPKVIRNFAEIILQEFIMEMAYKQDTILIIETRFNIVGSNIRCPMFILPTEEAMNFLLRE